MIETYPSIELALPPLYPQASEAYPLGTTGTQPIGHPLYPQPYPQAIGHNSLYPVYGPGRGLNGPLVQPIGEYNISRPNEGKDGLCLNHKDV